MLFSYDGPLTSKDTSQQDGKGWKGGGAAARERTRTFQGGSGVAGREGAKTIQGGGGGVAAARQAARTPQGGGGRRNERGVSREGDRGRMGVSGGRRREGDLPARERRKQSLGPPSPESIGYNLFMPTSNLAG